MANLKMRDERCKDERNDPGLTLSCSNRYDPTPHMMNQAMQSCLSACDSCARCNYVSFSWHFEDCACPLALNRTRVIACRCVLPANARVLHRFVVRRVRHGKAPAPARWKLVSIPVGKCLYEPAAHRASGPRVAAGIEGEAARAAAAAGMCTAWPSKRHAHGMCVARTSWHVRCDCSAGREPCARVGAASRCDARRSRALREGGHLLTLTVTPTVNVTLTL